MPDCLIPPRRPVPEQLPSPDAEALALSGRLAEQIRAVIDQAEGAIPFDRFMELALYAPGLGYYVAGSRKFGEAGDFITAPEVSPLFAQCLARQAFQVLNKVEDGEILECGPGSGIMAAEMLAELQRLDCLPQRYLLLELSPELRERQHGTIAKKVPELLERVVWLDRFPLDFSGLVVANELLDAMPVSRFRFSAGEVEECFVAYDDEGFKEVFQPVQTPGLQAAIEMLLKGVDALPDGYVSEINLRQAAWLKALGESLQQGAVLLIDYGYPRAEYYHPQRTTGTLMCHYRHRAHADPFRWVGLQDITAQVDFSFVAQSAQAAGMKLAGYTTQAHFLLASGLDELMARADPNDVASFMRLTQGVKKLTLPSEMGERFKVLGLVKGMPPDLSGFSLRDLSDRL